MKSTAAADFINNSMKAATRDLNYIQSLPPETQCIL